MVTVISRGFGLTKFAQCENNAIDDPGDDSDNSQKAETRLGMRRPRRPINH